jgi:hypothetical protein
MKFSIARSHRLARTAIRLFPNGIKLMGLFALGSELTARLVQRTGAIAIISALQSGR